MVSTSFSPRRVVSLVSCLALLGGLLGCAPGDGKTSPTPPPTQAPERTSTPTSDQALTPQVDCVVDMGNDLYVAFFGYTNATDNAVSVPLGPQNALSPVPQDPDQQPPTGFRPGGSLKYPQVTFGVEFDGADLTWTLQGRTAVANRNSPQCPLTTTPVQVKPDETYQTIKGWGGAFMHESSKSWVEGPHDAVSRYNLDHFDVTHIRVSMPLQYWEPVNDNDDPLHYDWTAFKITDETERVWEFMREVSRRDIQIIASVWNVPDWLVQNPGQQDKLVVAPDLYDELMESICAWLLFARTRYGVEVDDVSFNEPNIGVNVSFSSQQYAELVARGGDRFVKEGLSSTRWVFAEANNVASTLTYSRPIWEDQAARPFLGPFVFHAWDASVPDRDIEQIRAWAAENQIETWITEAGYDPALWERPEEFETWENAVKLARLYSRLYKLSGANVIFYWQMMDDYRLVSSDGTQPFPAFYILRQFETQLPAGSTIVGASANTEDIYSVAARAESHFALHLTNAGRVPEEIELSGLPAGSYSYVLSRSGALMKHVDTFEVADGATLRFVLPRLSVAVLSTLPPEE